MAGRARAFTPHLAAACALLLVLGIAAVGGTRPPPTETVAAGGTTSVAPTGTVTLDGERGDDGTSTAAGDAASTTGTPATGTGPATATPSRSAAAAPGTATAGAVRSYPPGVSDSEIRIGGSTFTSGPAAVYGEQIAVGFAAGVRYINDHGGINGRRVSLILYDDGGDPAKQLVNTKRLVEVDKVFALTMVYAPIAGEYVASKGIPVFHLGQFNEEFTNPWFFPTGGPQRLAAYATAWFGVKRLGVESVAIFYLDAGAANYSRQYAEDAASDWEAYGVDVPVLAPFAPDQTSCSDAIGQARDAGVEFIQFEIDASKVINCGVEAQLQGYKPPKGWGGYLIGVPVIHEALGDYSIGMYAFDAFESLYQAPVYREYVGRVSSSTEYRSSVTASYFTNALLMRDAIGALGNDITREGVRDAIHSLRDWNTGLEVGPEIPHWNWRPDCHVALAGGYVIQIQKVDGELLWVKITEQFTETPLPPGRQPPPEFSACDVFRRETR